MVTPVLLIALFLLFAFLYPLFEKLGRPVVTGLGALVAAAATAVSVGWLLGLAAGAAPVVSETAGFLAPLSIQLSVGLGEAATLVVINLIATLVVLHVGLAARRRWSGRQVILLFVLFLGANGLVMTRDVFNVFVFMEVSAISLFGILSTSSDRRVYEAGFKYMIAGGLASIFYLVGTIFLYRFTGTLSLDAMTGTPIVELHGLAGLVAVGFFLVAILVELKPIFANGWALDTYEAADNGTAAIISAISTTAMAAVLLKVLPFITAAAPTLARAVPVVGAVSFLVASAMALPQQGLRRMLGFSSVAQTGLVLLVAGTLSANPFAGASGALLPGLAAVFASAGPYAAALVVLLSHALAKAALFWIADQSGHGAVAGETPLRGRPVLVISAGIAVLALLGLPPFPAFFAKWAVLSSLAGSGSWLVVAIILTGSLLEAAYLGRWFLGASRAEGDSCDTVGELVPGDRIAGAGQTLAPAYPTAGPGVTHAAAYEAGAGGGHAAAYETAGPGRAHAAAYEAGAGGRHVAAYETAGPGNAHAPAAATALAGVLAAIAAGVLLGSGLAMAGASGVSLLALAPVAALAVFALFDLVRLPQKLQLVIALGVIGFAGYWYLPQTGGLAFVFLAMFLGGTALALFAFWGRTGAGDGSVGLVVSLAFALVTVVTAGSGLELFLAWELMTITSLLLLARGARAAAGALRYLVFSLFSAYLLLAGLLLLPGGWTGSVATIGALDGTAVAAVVLVVLAALIKLGSVGVHVWLPSSYAEAPDDVTPLFSAVLSKAGLFLLIVVVGALATRLVPALSETALGGISIAGLVGWIGVATALAGSLMALFQEDIKYSLAYSSMGQIGYMVLAFSMLSHLGHVTGLYLAVVHLMVKLVLWIAILGVIQQTGTRLMYKMGGLIKKMPISFISVLFGIIVVSGVPPLAGFGGKWLLYTALLEEGWYLHAGLAFFASAVAFLYLYRLIHSIFLGQPKDELAHVKEAPLVQLLPQLLLLAVLMGVSMFPNLLVKPLQSAVEPLFAATVRWEGYSVISSLGYWNGNAVMYITMGVFLAPLVWLLLVNGRKVTKVKQFNIVYAAERPYKPETTHYAFNFFGHYQKALGGLVAPWGERIWTGVGRVTSTIGDGLRRWNTGNPQTYGFQILLFLLVILLAVAGGLS